MSCGDPHETPCSDVLAAVYLYLDGEQDAEHHDKIRIHLDECSPCLRAYGLEQEVKILVARCTRGEHAPDGLRSRVLVKLREVRAEIDHVEYRAE